jgi:CRP-like cAMP-binding protein
MFATFTNPAIPLISFYMLQSLRQIALFNGIDEETQRLVEQHFESYSCPAGTIIFEQGDPAVFLYLTLRGSVTVRYKPYDGPSINLTQIPPGGAFGWSAVIGNPVYTSGTIAREDLQAIRIRGTDLREAVAHNPRAGKELLDRLASLVSNRWKDANRQVRAILEQAVPQDNSVPRRGKNRMTSPANFTKEVQIKALIDRLSAYVEQFHGGTVEFVSLNGNRLEVRLGGACLGCPLLPSTLHGWVAGTIHQFFPELEVVSAE